MVFGLVRKEDVNYFNYFYQCFSNWIIFVLFNFVILLFFKIIVIVVFILYDMNESYNVFFKQRYYENIFFLLEKNKIMKLEVLRLRNLVNL